MRLPVTTGIAGTATGTARLKAQAHGITPTTTTPAPAISMHMDAGLTSPGTATSGSRMTRVPTGRLISQAAGFGSPTGVGPGFPTSPGAGRRITTAAGFIGIPAGYGGRDQFIPTTVPSGR